MSPLSKAGTSASRSCLVAARSGQAADPDGCRRGLLCPRPGPRGRISTLRNGRRSTDWDTLSGLIRVAGTGGACGSASFNSSSAFLTSFAGPIPTSGWAGADGSTGTAVFGGRPRRFGAVAGSSSVALARMFLAAVLLVPGLAAGRRTSVPSTKSASIRSPLFRPRVWRRPMGSAIQPS